MDVERFIHVVDYIPFQLFIVILAKEFYNSATYVPCAFVTRHVILSTLAKGVQKNMSQKI